MGSNVNPDLVAAMSLIEQLREENKKLISMWEQAPQAPIHPQNSLIHSFAQLVISRTGYHSEQGDADPDPARLIAGGGGQREQRPRWQGV